MTMLPILPVLPDETITSYLRRVAKFHVGMGDVYSFLGALNLSRTAVIDPSSETLAPGHHRPVPCHSAQNGHQVRPTAHPRPW